LLIGQNSFLAKQFLAATNQRGRIRAVSHQAISELPLDGISCVINFSYTPHYFSEAYRPEDDVDRFLADDLSGRGIHYIMFSTRMVYGPNTPQPINEQSMLNGQGAYGKNKVISEAFVRERLGTSLTILRLANIFGFEPDRHTFMGHALRTLKGIDKMERIPVVIWDMINISSK
jgi:hypothetical protein